MSWDNRGRADKETHVDSVWHVDHIVPSTEFDFTTAAGQRAYWHYTNLRPMWARPNVEKGASLDYYYPPLDDLN